MAVGDLAANAAPLHSANDRGRAEQAEIAHSAAAAAAGAAREAVRTPRMRVNRWLLAQVPQIGEWTLLIAGLAAVVWAMTGPEVLNMPLRLALPLLAAMAAVKFGIWSAGVYDLPLGARVEKRAARVASGVALGWSMAIIILAFTLSSGWYVEVLGLLFLFVGLMIIGLHALFGYLMRGLSRAGALAETAVVVGATEAAQSLILRAHASDELRVLGVFDDRMARAPTQVAGVPMLGAVDDLFNWPRLPEVDRIIVTVSSTAEIRVRTLIERLKILPNRVVLLLDLERLSIDADRVGALADSPAAFIADAPDDARRAFIKRIQDLVIGTGLLALFAIPMLVIFFLVRYDSPGPAIFRQVRHGFNNREITVLKFRSMYQERTDADAATQIRANDDRVTPIGRILRKTSLDELPQLFNVLAGDMSLVGPRPHAPRMRTGDVESHKLVAEYAHRHRMKPGLTGWAQINGSRGPLNTPEEVRERIAYDLEYIDRASFWFDLWIILKTVPALLGDKVKIR